MLTRRLAALGSLKAAPHDSSALASVVAAVARVSDAEFDAAGGPAVARGLVLHSPSPALCAAGIGLLRGADTVLRPVLEAGRTHQDAGVRAAAFLAAARLGFACDDAGAVETGLRDASAHVAMATVTWAVAQGSARVVSAAVCSVAAGSRRIEVCAALDLAVDFDGPLEREAREMVLRLLAAPDRIVAARARLAAASQKPAFTADEVREAVLRVAGADGAARAACALVHRLEAADDGWVTERVLKATRKAQRAVLPALFAAGFASAVEVVAENVSLELIERVPDRCRIALVPLVAGLLDGTERDASRAAACAVLMGCTDVPVPDSADYTPTEGAFLLVAAVGGPSRGEWAPATRLALTTSKSAEVRAAACGAFDDQDAELVAAVRHAAESDSDSRVRRAAVKALGSRLRPEVAERIARFDADDTVRRLALALVQPEALRAEIAAADSARTVRGDEAAVLYPVASFDTGVDIALESLEAPDCY